MANKEEFDEVMETLKKTDLFKDFANNEEAIRKIANHCKVKSVGKGYQLIKEGDKGDELYILIKGDIAIVKRTLQNEEYTVLTLKGEWGNIYVGEQALLDDDRRSATVYTKTQCKYLVFNRKDFMDFGDQNPAFGLMITRVLAKRLSENLRKANKDIIVLFSALVDEVADEHLQT